MTIAEELTQLASRVDANLEENIDLEDVAGAIRAIAEKCAGKVLARPKVYQPTGKITTWLADLCRCERGASEAEALANLQAELDAHSVPFTPEAHEGG